jgi:hypothetical protein
LTPPPLFRSKTLSFASKSPLICSPKRALMLGADGSSLNCTLALSDLNNRHRCAVVVPVTPPSIRPPCVASLARPPPPKENISWYSGRLFISRCLSTSRRRCPRRPCIRQEKNPVNRSLPPQTGRGGTTVPGRRRGKARLTIATRCGGFVVAPLLPKVPQWL